MTTWHLTLHQDYAAPEDFAITQNRSWWTNWDAGGVLLAAGLIMSLQCFVKQGGLQQHPRGYALVSSVRHYSWSERELVCALKHRVLRQ